MNAAGARRLIEDALRSLRGPPEIVSKIERLIAVTTSSAQEEARTAAFQATKLIREHGYVLVEGAALAALEAALVEAARELEERGRKSSRPADPPTSPGEGRGSGVGQTLQGEVRRIVTHAAGEAATAAVHSLFRGRR